MRALSPEELLRKENATHYASCERAFSMRRPLVMHHEHVTGEFIDFVCNHCNLQLKAHRVMAGNKKDRTAKFLIPVIFHNLKNYDAKLILSAINSEFKDSEISAIASNTEKFMSFTIDCFKFVDSMQFLNCSLDSLASNLSKDDPAKTKFAHTKRHFDDSEKFELVTRKGVFPYEYMSGPAKFAETELPPIEAFYSKLSDENITEIQYAHAKTVWGKFNMCNMQNYHDLYLKTDVLLLADVFEAFRVMSLNSYKLDPLHYLTAPGLSWDSMLKMTRVKLELFTEPEKLLFVEEGIRGGVSMISNLYSKANNPYIEEHNDPQEEHKYLLYVDANNLYGWSMTQPLPLRNFRFLTPPEVSSFQSRLMTLTEDDPLGYILEVDLEYPEHLHDSHNDYPLAPAHFSVPAEMLSPYAKELLTKFGRKIPSKGH